MSAATVHPERLWRLDCPEGGHEVLYSPRLARWRCPTCRRSGNLDELATATVRRIEEVIVNCPICGGAAAYEEELFTCEDCRLDRATHADVARAVAARIDRHRANYPRLWCEEDAIPVWRRPLGSELECVLMRLMRLRPVRLGLRAAYAVAQAEGVDPERAEALLRRAARDIAARAR